MTGCVNRSPSEKSTLYHENGKLNFHTKARGVQRQCGHVMPHRFLRVFVPLCETKTATILFINDLYKTCYDIIYPLCCYRVEKSRHFATLHSG